MSFHAEQIPPRSHLTSLCCPMGKTWELFPTSSSLSSPETWKGQLVPCWSHALFMLTQPFSARKHALGSHHHPKQQYLPFIRVFPWVFPNRAHFLLWWWPGINIHSPKSLGSYGGGCLWSPGCPAVGYGSSSCCSMQSKGRQHHWGLIQVRNGMKWFSLLLAWVRTPSSVFWC